MIKGIDGKEPQIHNDSFTACNATIIGDVNIEKGCSIWYGAVIRSDMNLTTIGSNTNIQENTTVHNDTEFATHIGDNVTIGHNCVIHGCTVMDNVLVGMGTVILNGASIGKNTIIGAGSLVTQNKVIPEGVLCMGSPAKVIRNLTEEEIKSIAVSAVHYKELGIKHKEIQGE